MGIRVAVVGTGSVAQSNYLPFLSGQQDLTLTYFSRTHAKAEECAKTFGGRAVGSAEELLAEEPDTVLVLTRETQRHEVIETLLPHRPKRLFFEKPLVAQKGQAHVCEGDFFMAKDLLQRCAIGGTETAMVFNYRFFEQTSRMRRIINERGFGKLIHACLFVNYACWSHCIDLLHLVGGRASQVFALSGNTPRQDAADVSRSFRLPNGATGTILGTSGTEFAFPLYQVMLNFEHGTIRLSDLDGPMDVFDKTARYCETHTLIGHLSRWDQYKASFEKSLSAYLDSIRNSEPPPVPGIAGLEELQFEVALRRSIERSRPVNVQEEFPLDREDESLCTR